MHSTSSQEVVEEDDEAALIDSLFMPGGILNPFLEDNAGTSPPSTSGGLGVVEGTTTGVMVENLAQDQGPNRGDSFWSGGVVGAPAAGGLGADAMAVHGETLWPIASTSTPIPEEASGAAVTTESLFGASGVNQTSNTSRTLEHSNIHDSDGTMPTSLFGYDNPHALNSMEKAVADLESPLVPSLHNFVSTSPPPPGLVVPTQEEEDVRQMIQALSSTLQHPNNPLDPQQTTVPTEQQPRRQPDSPPKIIRQRSSISDNHRNVAQGVAVAGDTLLPVAGARNNGVDLMDHLSTTSSLSSGSAQPKEHQQTSLSTSRIPAPASTSLLGDPTGLLPFQPQEQGLEPSILQLGQVPPSSAFLLSHSAAVSPPPGYDSLQQHQQDQTKRPAMPTPAVAVTALRQSTSQPPSGLTNIMPNTNSARQGPNRQGIGSQQQQPLSYSAVSRRPGANKASSSLSPRAFRTSAVYKPPSTSQSGQPKQSQIKESSQQHPIRKAVSNQNTAISFTNNASASAPPKNVAASPLPTVSPKQRKQFQKQQQQQYSAKIAIVSPTKTKPNLSNSKKVSSCTSQQQTELQRQTMEEESMNASVSSNSSREEDNANTNTRGTTPTRGGVNGTRTPNGDSNESAIRSATTGKAHGKQQRHDAPMTQNRQWSEWAFISVGLFLRMFQFGGKVIACLMQEAGKEATEQKTISAYYILLYMTPILSLFLIDLSVWLPHYFPGMTMAAVLWWICRRIVNETDPSLLLEAEASIAYQSMSPEDQAAHHSSNAKKKITRSTTSRQPTHSHSSNYNQNRDPASSEAVRLRLRVLHSMEAKICFGLVRNLRWSLPLLVFVHSVVGPPTAPPLWDEEAKGEHLLPSIRLVAAFGLAVLKTHNILSPVAWVSGAIQILCVLAMQNTQSLMERWCGLEIVVTTLGLAALRFMRLHGATTTTSSSAAATSTLGGYRQKHL